MTEIVLAPELNADLLALTQHLEQWVLARAALLGSGGMLQGFEQQIGGDTENAHDVGPNYYPRLAAGGFFSGLQARGIPFAIETPGLKAWDTHGGLEAAGVLVRAIDRICAAGGELATYTFDDPLAASLSDFHPPVSMDVVIGALTNVAAAAAVRGVYGGITEAYPTCSAAGIVEMCERLQQAGYGPKHLYIDFDLQHALQVHTDAQIRHDLMWLQAQCRAWTQGDQSGPLGARAVCKFGLIVNGQRGDTPQAYHDEALKFLHRVRGWLGEWPDRIVLESWKKRNLPVNLPESDPLSHTGLLLAVAQLIGGS